MLIRESDAQKIKELFNSELQAPVTLELFVKPTPVVVMPGHEEPNYSDEAKELLSELVGLSDKLTLAIHNVEEETELAQRYGVTEVPTVVFNGAAKGTVRYLGLPLGYEFSAFLEDIVEVGRGSTDLSPATLEALAKLDHDVRIQVFVTPTCPYCPAPARIAHQMAIVSDRVFADVVEVSEFPELGDRYQVQGVPKIVINDEIEMLGAQPEAAFVQALQKLTAKA